MVYVDVITSQSVITQRRYVKNLSYLIMIKWNYHISSAVQVRPRGWFDMKTQPLPYKISHCRNKTILWPFAPTHSRWMSYPNGYPRRNNNVIITSKRHCGALWTKQWRYYYVLCMLRYYIFCPLYENPILNSATGYNDVSMPGLKLIHNSKRDHDGVLNIIAWTGNHISHNSMICNYLFIPLVLHGVWLHIPTNTHD